MANNEAKETMVRIPCRISYANIWEPRSINGNAAKYSVCCIIPKNRKDVIAKIEKAVEAAKARGKEKFWSGKIPNGVGSPLHDGDSEKADDEAYADSFYINAKNSRAPKVFDRSAQPLTDPSAVYSGCYCNVDVSFYPYNNSGKGIAASLMQLQLVKEGEPLGGIAADSFEALDDDPALEDDLPDFMK